MTVQINIRLPEETARRFDRVAGARGMARPEATRWAIDEVIEADALGRAVFERPAKPHPANLEHLAGRVESLTVELERVCRQNAKRDSDLAREAREDTLGVSAARRGIADDVTARLREALDGISDDLSAVRADAAARAERPPQLGAIEDRLAAIEALAARPLSQTTIAVGDLSFSWRAVGLVLGGAWLASLAVFVGLALVLPAGWLAVPSANFLLGGGDQAVCALVDYRMAVDSCRTTMDGETLRVTVDPRPEAARGR